MKGRRLATAAEFYSDTRQPGDYVKIASKDPDADFDADTWYICDPLDHVGALRDHTVTEHEDGTISVSPSILDSATYGDDHTPGWHGYLERGVWRGV